MRPPSSTRGASTALEHVACGIDGVTRLVDYMKDRLALVPVTEIGDLITSGFVRIGRQGCDGSEVFGRTFDRIADGDRIVVDVGALAALEAASRWNPPWDHPLSILHEDDDMLVIDKPSGMHVHPLGDKRCRTLVSALVHHAGGRSDSPWSRWRPHVVQRLDCVVSGLLVVAKNAEAKAMFVRSQKRHELVRVYLAMVEGRVGGDEGLIDEPLGREPGRGYRRAVVAVQDGGRAARTRWKVSRRYDDRTLLEVSPETGRTHQIRVHLAGIGHPIVGDHLYSGSAPAGRLGDGAVTAIALHATRVGLRHPRSGEAREFHSAPPADFGTA